jgi:hypothetical protein
MTASTPSARFFFTHLAVLGLTVTLAQGTDSESGSSARAKADPVPPPVETKVPATIADPACDSGQRNIVKIFLDGTLVKTERKDCVT